MTELDLSVEEELSRSLELCLSNSIRCSSEAWITVFPTKNQGDRERSPWFLFSKLLLHGIVVEDHPWGKDYLVTIGEQMPVDTIALIGNAVQAIGILDQPRAILPTHPSVQA